MHATEVSPLLVRPRCLHISRAGMTLPLGKEGGEKLRFRQAMHVPAIIVEGGRTKSYPAVLFDRTCVLPAAGGTISYVSLRATCCARADFCLELF
jgi:hypothetical protein